jgi:aspartate/tyrosine/aromatic aminotransferase
MFADERVGNLTVVVNSKEKIPDVKSQFQLVVRGMYSNPPCHGARIVAAALTTKEYFQEW